MTVYEYTFIFTDSTELALQIVSMAFLDPVCLLIDFSVFLYLLSVYINKRRDAAVNLLLVVAFIAFAVLIPFAYNLDYGHLRGSMFNVSDVLSVVTFLLRIYIICRDVTKSMMKTRMLTFFFILAKLLIVMELFDATYSFAEMCSGESFGWYPQVMSDGVETFSLFFITIFRFYYLSLLRGGWRAILAHRKFELAFYLFFITHEIIIGAIEDATGYDLESFAAIWMRACIAVLVYMSALRSRGKTYAISTRGTGSVVPSNASSLNKSEYHGTQIGSVGSSVPNADIDAH